MNCNIYFFIGTQKGYSQYPDNYSKDIISNILTKTDRTKNISQFAISINGKLAYITYQYRYSDSKFLGICCEYNGVVPTNFEYLFEFFDNIVQDILTKGEIIHYDSTGSVCPSVDYLSDKIELVNYYSSYISNHLNDKLAKYINLPPQNYTSEKKKVVVLAYDDNHTHLVDLLYAYDNVVISRDNPYVLGYANTLKKSSEKISQLETELAKIKRQKKQYRIVVFLILAVVACLVTLYSFNSNIQSLNDDLSQRKGEIKALSNALTIANAQIDKISLELSDKNQRIGVLQTESIKNRNSIDSLNNLAQNQETIISDLRIDLSSKKKELSDYKDKVGKHLPLAINYIEFANYTTRQGSVISDYGQRIYSSEARFIWFRINYDGIMSGTKKLYYKIYDKDGQLTTCASSPTGYTYSSEIDVFGDNNSVELFGYGADQPGIWAKGTYKIEVWYNDMCLKAQSFTIY